MAKPEMTEVTLNCQYNGSDKELRRIKVPGNFVLSCSSGNPRVDEKALIKALPEGFLPNGKAKDVLLYVTVYPGIEAAVAKPAKFRSWKPALDAFSLTVTEARSVRKTIRRARSE